MTLNEGLRIVESHNLLLIEISIDSQKVIIMLKEVNLFYNIVFDDCRSRLRRPEGSVVHHNCREQNSVADVLAKRGAKFATFDGSQVFVAPNLCP